MTSAAEPEFTAGQIAEAIVTAMETRELDQIPGLLKLLATVDPRRAQLVLDTLHVGLAIAAERDAAEV